MWCWAGHASHSGMSTCRQCFLLTKTKSVVNKPNSNLLTKTKTKLSGKLKRKMYNEFIIVLGNYQQIAVTKREEGTGITLCY